MKNVSYRKLIITILICFSAWILASAGVRAAPVVFNTGVDDSGIVLPIGTADPHYIMSGASNQAFVISKWPTWTDLPGIVKTAAWIGPTSSPSGQPAGQYTYTLTFDLGGSVPNNFGLRGKWASDNMSTIELNGADTGFKTPMGAAFSGLNDFSLNTGFQTGPNYLAFIVTNDSPPASDNPTGLLVAVQAVPIPGTAWILGSGLICLVGLRRKRRSGERGP